MKTTKKACLAVCILTVLLFAHSPVSHATVTVNLSDSAGADSFNVVNSGSSTIFHALSTGFVGIGTTTPSFKLVVTGTVTAYGLQIGSVTSSTYVMPIERGSSGQVLTAGSSGDVSWATASASSSVWPTAIDGGSITVTTNVGVGTTTVETALGVGGTATVKGLQVGTMSFPDADGSSGQFLTTDGSGLLTWTTSSSSSVWPTGIANGSITTTTNVGIGTSTAATALEVGGDTFVNGTLTVSGSSATLTIVDTVTNLPQLKFIRGSSPFFGADGSTDYKILDQGGTLKFIQADTNTGQSTIMSFKDNSQYVGIGNEAPASMLDVTGTITSLAMNTGSITVSGTATISGLKVGSGTSNTYVMPSERGSNGQVLTAGSSGDVQWGTLSLTASEIATGAVTTSEILDGTIAQSDLSGSMSISTSGSVTATAGLSVGDYTLNVIASNNLVQIGGTSTASTAEYGNSKLFVVGTITAFGLQIGTNTSSNYAIPNTRGTSGQVLTAGASGGSVTWSTPSSSSSVWPTSIDNGSITVETFVGVGTTSAQTALGVGGTATVSGNVIIGGNLAVTGTATVNGGMTVSGTTTVVGLQIGTMSFPDVDGTAAQVLSTDGSGVVTWADAGSSSLTVTTVSSNTTISTANQLVIITNASTLTLPASPATGQQVYIYTKNTGASLNLNSKSFFYSVATFDTATDTFANWGFHRALIFYDGTSWYLMSST